MSVSAIMSTNCVAGVAGVVASARPAACAIANFAEILASAEPSGAAVANTPLPETPALPNADLALTPPRQPEQGQAENLQPVLVEAISHQPATLGFPAAQEPTSEQSDTESGEPSSSNDSLMTPLVAQPMPPPQLPIPPFTDLVKKTQAVEPASAERTAVLTRTRLKAADQLQREPGLTMDDLAKSDLQAEPVVASRPIEPMLTIALQPITEPTASRFPTVHYGGMMSALPETDATQPAIDDLARDIVDTAFESVKLQFSLSNRTLGELHVDITAVESGFDIRLQPDNGTAVAILSREEPRMAEELRQSGVRLANNDLIGSQANDARRHHPAPDQRHRNSQTDLLLPHPPKAVTGKSQHSERYA